jgi:hypothetical protein
VSSVLQANLSASIIWLCDLSVAAIAGLSAQVRSQLQYGHFVLGQAAAVDGWAEFDVRE